MALESSTSIGRNLYGFRRNGVQLGVAGALTVLCGCALQLQANLNLDSAGRQFFRTSYQSKVAFLAPFSFCKAGANLVVGVLADRAGRWPVQVTGWCLGLFIPFMVLASAGSKSAWSVLSASAAVLGLHQGFVWSVTILIYMDLLGSKRRGLASGLNETIGYAASAIFSQVYGFLERDSVECHWIDEATDACRLAQSECHTADQWTQACVGECVCSGYTRTLVWVLGGLMVAGLLLTLVALKETKFSHVLPELLGRYNNLEADSGSVELVSATKQDEPDVHEVSESPIFCGDEPAHSAHGLPGSKTGSGNAPLLELVREVSYGNTNTMVICIAGFVTNFVTGLALGLIASWARDGLRMSSDQRNFYAACYSFMKGMSQFLTGHVSDNIGRRSPIVGGLLGSGVALLVVVLGAGFNGTFQQHVVLESRPQLRFGYLVLGGTLLGGAQGLLYPVLAAAITDHTSPLLRATAMGIFRAWRDLGYAAGALIAVVADAASPELAILLVAGTTLWAGGLVMFRYKEAQQSSL